jgi:Coenzyme PQQ synthesis protein D (PqqD)
VTTLRLRDSDLTWLEVQGELVALDESASAYLSANDSGLVLWQALGQGSSREELVALLLERFDVDEDRAAADVDAFLADLRARDLLQS